LPFSAAVSGDIPNDLQFLVPVVDGPAATLAGMTLIAEILLVILLIAVPMTIVGSLFVWGARKDGEEDRALQRRLGIRRRTRLGR
jgi:hypothetical protein